MRWQKNGATNSSVYGIHLLSILHGYQLFTKFWHSWIIFSLKMFDCICLKIVITRIWNESMWLGAGTSVSWIIKSWITLRVNSSVGSGRRLVKVRCASCKNTLLKRANYCSWHSSQYTVCKRQLHSYLLFKVVERCVPITRNNTAKEIVHRRNKRHSSDWRHTSKLIHSNVTPLSLGLTLFDVMFNATCCSCIVCE